MALKERGRSEEDVPGPHPLLTGSSLNLPLDDGRFTLVGDSIRQQVEAGDLAFACEAGGYGEPNADFLLLNDGIRIGGKPYRLFALFDGVSKCKNPVGGGPAAAEVFNTPSPIERPEDFMLNAFQTANKRLLALGSESTAAVALYDPEKRELLYGHTGDSRIYLIEPNTCAAAQFGPMKCTNFGVSVTQLTTDHLYMLYPQIGMSKLLGFEETVEPEFNRLTVPAGHPVLALMTDGAHGPICRGREFSHAAAIQQCRTAAGRLSNFPKLVATAIMGAFNNNVMLSDLVARFKEGEPNLRDVTKQILHDGQMNDATCIPPMKDDRTMLMARL